MSPDPAPDAGNPPPEDPPPEPASNLPAAYAPKLAVLAVACVAVAAAFMGTRTEPPAADAASSAPPPRQAVVRAPPLVVAAPPLQGAPPPTGVSSRSGGAPDGLSSAMGAAAGCERCGVVESVLAAAPGQSFQMRIRMDDGSVQTLEQRGALAAGTRVMVEGGSVRLMPG